MQIDGFLAQDVWEKDGKKHYAFKVVAQTVRPIKSSGGSSGGSGFIEEDNEDDWDEHPF